MSALRPGWLVEQLPRVLAQDELLARFVGALESMAADARTPLDEIEHLVDVDLAPAPFVRWLGGWIGVPVEEGLPERRQREVVRVAGKQFPWRGTRRGLRELIEAYTGHEVRVEDSGRVVPYGEVADQAPDRRVTIHIRGAGGIDEHHLLRLVEQEIPADASAELRVEDHAVEAEDQPQQLTEEDAEAAAPVSEGPGPMAPRSRSAPPDPSQPAPEEPAPEEPAATEPPPEAPQPPAPEPEPSQPPAPESESPQPPAPDQRPPPPGAGGDASTPQPDAPDDDAATPPADADDDPEPPPPQR